ncbi:hypothetical protein GCM10010211_72420 [Streptomyces albospinus]|uniref:Uncharacterized protein n=1 Tax=Streptomyces albospinus TaxID=285515 RepID=A0ABQ2VMY4_9ACTN|nr:hypothetical protein GCM10010211_72420 [Streptomyces albospinus]
MVTGWRARKGRFRLVGKTAAGVNRLPARLAIRHLSDSDHAGDPGLSELTVREMLVRSRREKIDYPDFVRTFRRVCTAAALTAEWHMTQRQM